MTQIRHARSRRTALLGLILQLLAFGTVQALYYTSHSMATYHLGFYLLGGVPIWLIALLMFRQRELAEFETLDLEQLRREKAATGGGQAIFDEEAAGFKVAATRLVWMQRWLVPAFGLLIGLVLAGGGLYELWMLQRVGLTLADDPSTLAKWGEFKNPQIAMVVLGIVTLCTYLYSRYASGMGRVKEWLMLRGCGSYLLGNTIFAALIIVSLGIQIYAKSSYWEHALTWAIPAVMLVLGIETLLNFVLDIYRPRQPGVEPRASFDSRLLGLISEPGGIAHSIAEAINYQFGFEVSQTWFYQLVQRAALPLLGTGAFLLWVLTCFVVVQPDEHVIIERFGRQINASTPWQPGPHFKWPWPIDIARKYDTGNVHQMYIGFNKYDAYPEQKYLDDTTKASLWTDKTHLGQRHHDFLIPLKPDESSGAEQTTEALPTNELRPEEGSAQAVPVNMMRMDVVVQYKIDPEALADYSQALEDPEAALRNIAWREVVRFNASNDIDSLLGQRRQEIGRLLQERIQKRVGPPDPALDPSDDPALGLGIEIVYVGLQNIHPEESVAKAFRDVVNAEQKKIGSIREALVKENETLSEVAGDKFRALRLAYAIGQLTDNDVILNAAERRLREVDPDVVAAFDRQLAVLGPAYVELERATWHLRLANEQLEQVEWDTSLGMQRTQADHESAAERVATAEAAWEQASSTVGRAIADVRAEMEAQLAPEYVSAILENAAARVAMGFWNAEVERQLPDLQGSAAVTLARARARRWMVELAAAAELTQMEAERDAYREAPHVYRARLYLTALAEGIKDSRKYFLAFEPGDRKVHIRVQAEEQARPDITDIAPTQKD
ncbi:MAG: hypothetical protein JXO22_15075 [Phycisphaerae bacterium]|nr:hypothetical protein [Phycisphaerae bacterium]